MASKIDEITTELDELLKEAGDLLVDLHEKYQEKEKSGLKFATNYESWYTVSRRVVATLLPERENDFVTLYRYPGVRKQINYDSYRIYDYLIGTSNPGWSFNTAGHAFSQFQIQIQILQSVRKRLKSTLMDMSEMLLADIFDSEIEKSRALHHNKLLREAGVIAGVVLEGHLQKVAQSHSIKIIKKYPTISDLNDPIKNAGIYDVPTWRLIQRLADIRNLCDHKKHRDPTADEVLELIDGTEKISKTIV